MLEASDPQSTHWYVLGEPTGAILHEPPSGESVQLGPPPPAPAAPADPAAPAAPPLPPAPALPAAPPDPADPADPALPPDPAAPALPPEPPDPPPPESLLPHATAIADERITNANSAVLGFIETSWRMLDRESYVGRAVERNRILVLRNGHVATSPGARVNGGSNGPSRRASSAEPLERRRRVDVRVVGKRVEGDLHRARSVEVQPVFRSILSASSSAICAA
jgi:hypothetical protein